MVRDWFSGIPRGVKAVLMAMGALLTFMLLWRAVVIIIVDIASYLAHH